MNNEKFTSVLKTFYFYKECFTLLFSSENFLELKNALFGKV